MLRRAHFYSIRFAFGLSVLLILAASRFKDNVNYHPSSESSRNIRNYIKTEDGEDSGLHPIPTNPYDGSPNVDKILDKTRSKIKVDLYNYNFTNSGVHQLEDLTLEAGGKPLRTIIVSTWRSGTTFLGEILNAMPGNFYHFEPLLQYGTTQIRGPPHAYSAITSMKKRLKCDFRGMDDYFEFGKTDLQQFNRNTRLWDYCKYKKELCFEANFTERFCKLFPFQSMKVVRLRLSLVQDILEDKELNVKVVLLIRDPRGVMRSRQHKGFCRPAAVDCMNPKLLCADMISDYVAAGRLLQKYPDRLIVLRHEELALNPKLTAHALLKFLQLSPNQSVNDFLDTHTNVQASGFFSTYRISRDVPFRWINLLNYRFVKDIQGACKEAMALWGYKLAYNATHMKSKDFYPMEPYTITQ